MLILAVVGTPILMIGLVWLVALQLRAEHDPDSLFEGESTGGADVPMKVAIGSAVLAMIGGFCLSLAFVGELSLGWLFIAWVFWTPVFHLLYRPQRKSRPLVTENDDVPLKQAIPRLVTVLAFGALIGAKVAGAIGANVFFVGAGVFLAALALLNRRKPR